MADVMKRVAAPTVGGLATSFAMELLVYPAIYLLWKWNTEVKAAEEVRGDGANGLSVGVAGA
jgi:Cu(I)/Ag(I) efflux system membrane protein CusA/SilA